MNKIKDRIFKETQKVDNALDKTIDNLRTDLKSESVSLEDALGRILVKDLESPSDIPPHDKSAMDGYAIIAKNTFGASINNPVILEISGKVMLGDQDTPNVRDEKAVVVYTGSKIPTGANAVIMKEYTNKVNEKRIEIYSSVPPGQNISRNGEDVKKGELILRKGTRLKPQDLGMLAALGFKKVKVLRKLKIAVLSTGSELVPLKKKNVGDRTIDVNRIIISAMSQVIGADVIDLGIAKDDLQEIKIKVQEGLKKGDLVIVTGGTSVGETDLTSEAINACGKPGMLVHGIAIRPGKPTGLAVVDGKLVASLSGYPIAAIVGFEALVKPILARILGIHEDPMPMVKARATRRIVSSLGERTYVRVRVKKENGELLAYPIRATGSGIISSMIRANGFLIIPEDREGIDEDEEVEILLFRPLDEIV